MATGLALGRPSVYRALCVASLNVLSGYRVLKRYHLSIKGHPPQLDPDYGCTAAVRITTYPGSIERDDGGSGAFKDLRYSSAGCVAIACIADKNQQGLGDRGPHTQSSSSFKADGRDQVRSQRNSRSALQVKVKHTESHLTQYALRSLWVLHEGQLYVAASLHTTFMPD
ncbi:hypothetical protein GLOTRDRAFT_93010 [Gloeophyllum trabeum ATCC 11539]|uniref:Uncharacterized protein n=1 Tax=Gloeophyllum trabeum (strain ATCC 11539 / FP-39264 / Madison 617) TaxID=670483 RepID=S7Q9K6_GLOTA|nr:uncharacterized protein GLOTRDRAFT_93010 [Gloeophyllum trabeum ATCC 11539]EPQ56606.1 hypothetical protein GLOTRDRAFT_93010 [Gloeophyllum trabeum ATCC 11539]